MMTNPPARITQGQFSFLPELTDQEITAQIDYGLGKGYAWSVMAFDNTRGVESIAMSFIVGRPRDEPGFRLVRQEIGGRSMRYTVQGYAADRPESQRY